MERPALNKNIPVNDFKDFYWLKEELVTFCKQEGINSTGGKAELTERIIVFLEKGVILPKEAKKERSFSRFDWNNAPLTTNTVITDNYKNTENVRRFFKEKIGNHFHFSTTFMKWMKANTNQTLNDAVNEWKRLNELTKDKNYKSEISSQFEYNQYIRDFLADNPGKSNKDAIACWKIKRMKRGSNKYDRSDINLL